MADFRHNVVHGHIRNVQWGAGVLEFSRKVKGRDGRPQRRTMTVRAEDLFANGREVKALIEPFMNLTHRLVAKFDPSYSLKETAGSLGWTRASAFPVVKKVGD